MLWGGQGNFVIAILVRRDRFVFSLAILWLFFSQKDQPLYLLKDARRWGRALGERPQAAIPAPVGEPELRVHHDAPALSWAAASPPPPTPPQGLLGGC